MEDEDDDQQDVATMIAKKKQTVRINPNVQVQRAVMEHQ
jgi:hypothetical protein